MPNRVQAGFVPWGSKVGGQGIFPQAFKFEVVSSYGTLLSAGDVMQIDDDGTVALAAAGETQIVGILRDVSYVSAGVRIFSTQIPVSTAFSPTGYRSANAHWAYIYTDPNTIYSCGIAVAGDASHDTAAELADHIGSNMDHVATAASTVYKASRHELDGTIVEGGTAGFRIIGVDDEIGIDPLAARGRLLVVINEGIDPFYTATSTS